MPNSRFSGKSFVKAKTHLSVGVDDNEIVLQTNQGIYYSLNATAQDLWSKLDAPCQYEDLVGHVLESYDVERDECEAGVEELVASLLDHQLIEEHATR